MRTFLNRCKRVMTLIGIGSIAYVFTFYLDGDIGVVIWSFLIIAPLLSVFLAKRACQHLTVHLEAPGYIAKGKPLCVRTCIRTEGSLPIPFLRCRLTQSPNLHAADGNAVQSAALGEQTLVFEQKLTAAHAGCGTVSAASFAVSDYLGLLQFRMLNLPEPVKFGVIPEIPSISGAGVLLHAVTDAVLTQDEEEEESSAAYSSTSMPGYIHRDYVPGDNLRRINWKMSVKRERLMVRMDEAAATVRPLVILDLSPETEEAKLCVRDRMLEGSLAFLLLLVRQGIACTIRYASGGEWNHLLLESEEAVRSAAVELAVADFHSGEHRLDPQALQEKAGAYMLYTTNPDAAFLHHLEEFRNHGYVCCVIPKELSADGLQCDALWRLSEDFSMTAVQK